MITGRDARAKVRATDLNVVAVPRRGPVVRVVAAVFVARNLQLRPPRHHLVRGVGSEGVDRQPPVRQQPGSRRRAPRGDCDAPGHLGDLHIVVRARVRNRERERNRISARHQAATRGGRAVPWRTAGARQGHGRSRDSSGHNPGAVPCRCGSRRRRWRRSTTKLRCRRGRGRGPAAAAAAERQLSAKATARSSWPRLGRWVLISSTIDGTVLVPVVLTLVPPAVRFFPAAAGPDLARWAWWPPW